MIREDSSSEKEIESKRSENLEISTKVESTADTASNPSTVNWTVLASLVAGILAICFALALGSFGPRSVDAGATDIYEEEIEKEFGSLHMKIGESAQRHCGRKTVVVQGFVPLPSGGPASAERSGVIQAGDIIARVDERTVLGFTFGSIVRELRAGNDTKQIVFVRPNASCASIQSRFHCSASICTTPPPTAPNTLVILMGNARGGEVAWDSMVQHVIRPLHADVALAFGNTSDRPEQLTSLAKYDWIFEEPNDWTEVLDEVATRAKVPTGRWRRHAQRKDVRGKGLYGPAIVDKGESEKGSGVIIFAFREWLLREQLHVLQSYDRVVLTRADHVYACDHANVDVQLGDPVIWLPEGEDYEGFTDRHHVFQGKDAASILGVLPWLVAQSDAACINPETCLKEYFMEVGLAQRVLRFPRSMYTVKRQSDDTRWTEGSSFWSEVPGHPGLVFKYPDEHALATEECARERGAPSPML